MLMLAVAALGYFVDVYDLLIFGAERIESLHAIGVAREDMKDIGIEILNFQMAGLIIGGFLFGLRGQFVFLSLNPGHAPPSMYSLMRDVLPMSISTASLCYRPASLSVEIEGGAKSDIHFAWPP